MQYKPHTSVLDTDTNVDMFLTQQGVLYWLEVSWGRKQTMDIFLVNGNKKH